MSTIVVLQMSSVYCVLNYIEMGQKPQKNKNVAGFLDHGVVITTLFLNS